MNRKTLNEIQGVLVTAGRTDLAESLIITGKESDKAQKNAKKFLKFAEEKLKKATTPAQKKNAKSGIKHWKDVLKKTKED